MQNHVKGLRHRRDGWTPERQRAFLDALAETGSMSRAIASVGLSRASLYKLLRRPDANAFDAALRTAHAGGKARPALPVRPDGETAIRTISAGPPRFNASQYVSGAADVPRKIVNFRPSGEIGDRPAQGAILSTSGVAPLAPSPAVP